MSSLIILTFCNAGAYQALATIDETYVVMDGAAFGQLVPREKRENFDLAMGESQALILLAVGPEGGANLARWVEAHGLDGVVGVGLVGVTAPWAERRSPIAQTLEEADAGRGAPFPLPLGPLEPLRKVAERAREGVLCCVCEGVPMIGKARCACAGKNYTYPLRFIIAAAPDDGVCAFCVEGLTLDMDDEPLCRMCDGTGKALSSADVAYELTGINADGSPDSGLPPRIDRGGVTVRSHETFAALTEHGLRSVIERLTR